MRYRRTTTTALILTILALGLPGASIAEEIWTVREGSTVVSLDLGLLRQLGLEVTSPGNPGNTDDRSRLTFSIDADSTLTFSVEHGSVVEFLGGRTLHQDGLSLTSRRGNIPIDNLIIAQVRGPATQAFWTIEGPTGGTDGLVFDRAKAGFDTSLHTLTIHCPELSVSPALAAALGDSALAGVVLGQVTTQAIAQWVGGTEPEAAPDEPLPAGDGRLAGGCDMVFCQLYGLGQYGRLGDIVGLSVATTSWNLGTEDCIWLNNPNEEHPFIIMNLYRLKDDRFEHIGQSWIKHGFYALGNTQCGGTCSYEPGHGQGNWLGQNCTDTYGAGLNASQGGLGPRHEVNPWTGYYYYPGSHLSGGHGHNQIEHRLQVHDADLDPAQNVGATYYCESFYVMLDDINAMNSASYKEVTVSGSPGGDWSFGMSGSGSMAEVGFAIKAWSQGISRTLLAQENPPIEFISPDGRCYLHAKATDLGSGLWHYEYALLNIDMDRKVGAFSVPATPLISVTNVGFHAVEHHDEEEAGYTNDDWTAEVADGTITWSTESNPVRWGTLYNFRFDAQAPPSPYRVDVTLEMFDPGDPAIVIGQIVGPCVSDPDGDIDGDDVTDGDDIPAFITAVISASTDNGDLCRADFNRDGVMDLNDVPPMVAALLAQ